MKIRKKPNRSTNSIAVLMIFIIMLQTVAGQDDETYSRDDLRLPKLRNRVREVRGFRPNHLSTAPNFGKRRDSLVTLRDLYTDQQLKRYSLPWYLEAQYSRQPRRNPSGDDRGPSSRQLLKSIRLISLR